jgi:signal transduction histidine kinase
LGGCEARLIEPEWTVQVLRSTLFKNQWTAWTLLSFAALFVTSYNQYDDHLTLTPRVILCAAAASLLLLSRVRPVASLVGLSAFCVLVGQIAPNLIQVQFLLVVVVFLVSWKTSFSLPATMAIGSFGITAMYYAKHFGEGRNELFSFAIDAVLTNGLAVGFGSQTRRLRVANDRLVALAVVDRRNAVVEERRRIARELHDVAAHHLSAVIVKSKVALKLNSQEDLRSANQFASDTATEALNSMRALVGVLSDVEEGAEFLPQPRLDALLAIKARMESAGLCVDMQQSPELPQLTRQVELAIVRIVQESLTNVLRHRGPGNAWIAIGSGSGVSSGADGKGTVHASGLRVTVDDDGSTSPNSAQDYGSGHGLLSMRERALACGGTLSVEASPRGGWRIAAMFPNTSVAAG